MKTNITDSDLILESLNILAFQESSTPQVSPSDRLLVLITALAIALEYLHKKDVEGSYEKAAASVTTMLLTFPRKHIRTAIDTI